MKLIRAGRLGTLREKKEEAFANVSVIERPRFSSPFSPFRGSYLGGWRIDKKQGHRTATSIQRAFIDSNTAGF